jgi:2-C-methyl-D-erythritol 4-phosphate cytidylyltransferase
MEQLTALRPALIQSLVKQKVSLKVKRLFLYMAEKANHPWYEMIDTSEILLDNGKRVIVKKGIYDAKYKIVIPEDLKHYE